MFAAQLKKASFNRRDLSQLIYGGKEGLDLYLKRRAVVESDPELKFNPSYLHQSRHDMMQIMGKKMLRATEYHDLFPMDGTGQHVKLQFFNYQMPLTLHCLMFLTTLDNLCDEEQRKEFYEPALQGKILGCYAQTQLGHGSDIQRLETTATYNKENETFVINSPTIGSTKWWIGDLGVHCTHAALFAQLIIDGKDYGLHTFLVPVRNPETFKTIPGVEAGDIGPKQGFNTKDNGFGRFNNLVIPRRNMLMKYHVVSKDGKYSRQGNERISYATMLMTRSNINHIVNGQFAKITTIATRYSLLRRQFKNQKGEQIPILDYQTQQAKVISRIGQIYAGILTSKNINEISHQVFADAKKGKFDRLKEAHVLTSATKAYITLESLNNAQIARRSAGGHGFNMYSGMIGLQHQISTCLTLEGEFTILMLQVARFLLQALRRLQKGKQLAPSAEYLQQLAKGDLQLEVTEDRLNCPFFVNQILKYFSCVSSKNMGLKMAEGISNGLSEKQAWDSYAGITLVKSAIAHSILTMHTFFLQEVMKIKQDDLKKVMKKLCILWGIEKLIERASQVYATGVISPEAFQLLNRKREALLKELRPEALALVEAFEFTDNMLQSAIAHSNERPYQNLIHWARNFNTVNRPEERSQIIEVMKKAKQELRPKL